MGAVDDMQVINNSNVRKWGSKFLALADYGTPVPTEFFDATRKPIMPANHKQLGLVTTDGISQAISVSSEATYMDQQLEPVRNDMTGIEQTVTVTFGEANAWVNALRHGLPVADWPDSPDVPWVYHDGDVAEYPYYRLLLVAQDGVGANALYRVEYGYRVTVTAMTDRNIGRKNPETYGFTFGLFKDPAAGRSLTRAQNGPAYPAAGQAGA